MNGIMYDKCCLVTGGASGMGREFALTLAREGAHVVVADISTEGIFKISEEARCTGLDLSGIEMDAAECTAVKMTVRAAVQRMGRIDILVNSVGVSANALAEENLEKLWHRIIQINLTGAFNCCSAAGEQMIEQKGGAIINIASMSASIVPEKTRPGRLGEYVLLAYCASKGGVKQLTRAIAGLWAGYGIRANSISPGYVDTPLTAGPHSDLQLRAALESKIPLGYIASPADIAGAVLFLASEDARYITGQDLVMDGGFVCR